MKQINVGFPPGMIAAIDSLRDRKNRESGPVWSRAATIRAAVVKYLSDENVVSVVPVKRTGAARAS